eukprot:TRINITY_DN6565_c0_g1_i1.p1 TRINITY_DN6565_c0_g1~~TRINITY_DN6565_c0_g1_i1.p1  ORF type:complete len:511 (-),score=111.40 TRINITY_DN6565_c0_g1_i1:107-1639(-)
MIVIPVIISLLLIFLYFSLSAPKTPKEKKENKEFNESNVRYSEEAPEVVIIGAGVAGSALAKALGDQNRRVLVLERDLTEPNRIVGELLQPGGVKFLEKLGLENCVEGIDSQRALGYIVFQDGKEVLLPFPTDRSGSVFEGRSFHHGRFIQKLRNAASECPTVSLVQGTVTRLIEDQNRVLGVSYKQKDGTVKEVRAPQTFVCDGCFSNFRSKLDLNSPNVVSHFVGVIVQGKGVLPYQNHGHVFLADPSPVLCYQIGENETRVLVDIPEPLPEGKNSISEYLLQKTAPQLPEKIRIPFIDAVNAGDVRKMPNMKLSASPVLKQGAIPIGDSWNIRHPLTGGGMSVALSDVSLLTDLLECVPDLSDQEAVDHVLQQFWKERKPLAATINILAFALYLVFAGSSKDPKINKAIQDACFGYFNLGGICVSGPMSMLSALVPNPLILLMHYCMVALYGAYMLLIPYPTPKNIWNALKVLAEAKNIFWPLVKSELLHGAGNLLWITNSGKKNNL